MIDFRNVRVQSLDEGSVQGPVTVEGDGEHTVEYRSTDVAGNEEEINEPHVHDRRRRRDGPGDHARARARGSGRGRHLQRPRRRHAVRHRPGRAGWRRRSGDASGQRAAGGVGPEHAPGHERRRGPVELPGRDRGHRARRVGARAGRRAERGRPADHQRPGLSRGPAGLRDARRGRDVEVPLQGPLEPHERRLDRHGRHRRGDRRRRRDTRLGRRLHRAPAERRRLGAVRQHR